MYGIDGMITEMADEMTRLSEPSRKTPIDTVEHNNIKCYNVDHMYEKYIFKVLFIEELPESIWLSMKPHCCFKRKQQSAIWPKMLSC